MGRGEGGRVVLPVNQVLTPAGIQVGLPGLRPQALALSPDGRLLATSGKTSEVVLVDPGKGRVLSRAELLRVASSLPVESRRLPRRIEGPAGAVVRRSDPRAAFDLAGFDAPLFLPPGYRAASALQSRSPEGTVTLTVRYAHGEAEYDGFGIRITQSRPARLLPPSSEQLERMVIGDVTARWSSERGVLEWIAGGIYRAVAAPSFGARAALRIAEGIE